MDEKKEGWYIIDDERCYLQKLSNKWFVWSPNGWRRYKNEKLIKIEKVEEMG